MRQASNVAATGPIQPFLVHRPEQSAAGTATVLPGGLVVKGKGHVQRRAMSVAQMVTAVQMIRNAVKMMMALIAQRSACQPSSFPICQAGPIR